MGQLFEGRRLVVTVLVVSLLSAGAGRDAYGAPFLRGDTNGNGRVDLTDAIRTLGFLFLGTPESLACADAADADDSGQLDLVDAVRILNRLFLGASLLPPPSAGCGPDPTTDALDCPRSEHCSARDRATALGDVRALVVGRSLEIVGTGHPGNVLTITVSDQSYRVVVGEDGTFFLSVPLDRGAPDRGATDREAPDREAPDREAPDREAPREVYISLESTDGPTDAVQQIEVEDGNGSAGDCDKNFGLVASPPRICVQETANVTATGSLCECTFTIVSQPGGWQLTPAAGSSCKRTLQPISGAGRPGCIEIRAEHEGNSETITIIACDATFPLGGLNGWIEAGQSLIVDLEVEPGECHTDVTPMAFSNGGVILRPLTPWLVTAGGCPSKATAEFLAVARRGAYFPPNAAGELPAQAALQLRWRSQSTGEITGYIKDEILFVVQKPYSPDPGGAPPPGDGAPDLAAATPPGTSSACPLARDRGRMRTEAWPPTAAAYFPDGTSANLTVPLPTTVATREPRWLHLRPQVMTEDVDTTRWLFGELQVRVRQALPAPDEGAGGRARLLFHPFDDGPPEDITDRAEHISGWSSAPLPIDYHNVSEVDRCYEHDWHWQFLADRFEVVGERQSAEPGDVKLQFTLRPTQGVPERGFALDVGVTVGGVEFVPNPLTHHDRQAGTVFPGDLERIESRVLDEELAEKVWYRIDDPSVARFHEHGAFLGELKAAGPEQTLEIYGATDDGETRLVAYAGHPDDPASEKLGHLPIKVGGSIEIRYDRPPTFAVDPATNRLPDEFASIAGNDPFDGRGAEVSAEDLEIEFGDGDFYTRPELLEELNGKQFALFELVLKDREGRPKKGKLVAILLANDILTVAQNFVTVDDFGNSGNIRVLVSQDLRHQALTTGVLHEQMMFVVGEAARKVKRGAFVAENFGLGVDLLALTNGGNPSPHLKVEHKNTGGRVVYGAKFLMPERDEIVTALSIYTPAFNNVWDRILEKWLAGGPFDYGSEGESQEITGVIPVADGSIEIDAYERFFEAPLDPTAKELMRALFSHRAYQYTALTSPANQEPARYGALVAEVSFAIGMSLIPGIDAVDLLREYFWKPIINWEAPDHVTGILAALGLAVDFFHLVPGVGTAVSTTANTMIGIARGLVQLLKKLPEGKLLVHALIKMDGTLKQSIELLWNFLDRLPGATQRAKLVRAYELFEHTLTSQLRLGVTHIAVAVRLLARKSTRSFSDEAVEGLAYVSRRGTANDTAEQLFDAGYSEETLEKAFEYYRLIHRGTPDNPVRAVLPSGSIDDVTDTVNLSDDALHGIVAATATVRNSSVPRFVRNPDAVADLLEGTVFQADGKLSRRAFRNISDLEGVEGLDGHLLVLHNTRNVQHGAIFPDSHTFGAVFEGTTARLLKRGELSTANIDAALKADGLPEPGALKRIGMDNDSVFQRADHCTESWSVQVKQRRDGSTLTRSSFRVPVDAYFEEMRKTAFSGGKWPVFVTNGTLDVAVRNAMTRPLFHQGRDVPIASWLELSAPEVYP